MIFVCLLHILNRLKEQFDIEIYAAHLNHQIRGIEAQKDALYVTRLCEEMGIKYFVRSIDVPKYCQENKIDIEIIHINNKDMAQSASTIFTTYSLFYNGRLITNEILSVKKFEKIVGEVQ